jgi:hypothetical protein
MSANGAYVVAPAKAGARCRLSYVHHPHGS